MIRRLLPGFFQVLAGFLLFPGPSDALIDLRQLPVQGRQSFPQVFFRLTICRRQLFDQSDCLYYRKFPVTGPLRLGVKDVLLGAADLPDVLLHALLGVLAGSAGLVCLVFDPLLERLVPFRVKKLPEDLLPPAGIRQEHPPKIPLGQHDDL